MSSAGFLGRFVSFLLPPSPSKFDRGKKEEEREKAMKEAGDLEKRDRNREKRQKSARSLAFHGYEDAAACAAKG